MGNGSSTVENRTGGITHGDEKEEQSFSQRIITDKTIKRTEWFPTRDILRLMDSVDSFGTAEQKQIKDDANLNCLFGGLITLPSASTDQQANDIQNQAGLKRFEAVLAACKTKLGESEIKGPINVNFALHNGKDHFTHLKVTLLKNERNEITIQIINNNSLGNDNTPLAQLSEIAKIIASNDNITAQNSAKGDQKNGYDCGAWTMHYLMEEAQKANVPPPIDPASPLPPDFVEKPSDEKANLIRLSMLKKLLALDAAELEKGNDKSKEGTQPYSDLQDAKRALEAVGFDKDGNLILTNPRSTHAAEAHTISLAAMDDWFSRDTSHKKNITDEEIKSRLEKALAALNTKDDATTAKKAFAQQIEFKWKNNAYEHAVKTDETTRTTTIELEASRTSGNNTTSFDITLTRQENEITFNDAKTPVVTWNCKSDNLSRAESFKLIAMESLALRKAQGLADAEKIGIIPLDPNTCETKDKAAQEYFSIKGQPQEKLSQTEIDLISAHLDAGYTEVTYGNMLLSKKNPASLASVVLANSGSNTVQHTAIQKGSVCLSLPETEKTIRSTNEFTQTAPQ